MHQKLDWDYVALAMYLWVCRFKVCVLRSNELFLKTGEILVAVLPVLKSLIEFAIKRRQLSDGQRSNLLTIAGLYLCQTRGCNRKSATRCSSIAILWVSLLSFTTITVCVASQRVFIAFIAYISLSTQSGNLWMHPRINCFTSKYAALYFCMEMYVMRVTICPRNTPSLV